MLPRVSKLKDLNQLLFNRSMKEIIMIDNNVESCFLNFENHIVLPSFSGNVDSADDQCLKILAQYLVTFKDCKDVRTKILKDFCLGEIFVKK